ncbi:MAG: magnesium transporter MgtE N-terminal domain-containing protein [Rickettsiales bacterium]
MAAVPKKKKKPQTPRLRLLPLTVVMLSLMLVIKLNDIFIGSMELRRTLTVSSAYAEDAKKPEEKPEAKSEAKPTEKADAKGGDAKKEEEEKAQGTGKSTVKEIEALKAKKDETQFTDVELDILQNLSKRREELDAREEELTLKQTVLAATEERINDKVREMKKLQEDLDKVLKLYNEKQEGEIKGLVKIYEAMKPGDAAAIFNELEMPILLDVIDKMSERKVAPILAGMDTKRARDVTQELAELRKIRAQTRERAAGL